MKIFSLRDHICLLFSQIVVKLPFCLTLLSSHTPQKTSTKFPSSLVIAVAWNLVKVNPDVHLDYRHVILYHLNQYLREMERLGIN